MGLSVRIHLVHIEIRRTTNVASADGESSAEPSVIGFTAQIERDYRESTTDVQAIRR